MKGSGAFLPVMMILRLVWILLMAMFRAEAVFFKMWPSSQMIFNNINKTGLAARKYLENGLMLNPGTFVLGFLKRFVNIGLFE